MKSLFNLYPLIISTIVGVLYYFFHSYIEASDIKNTLSSIITFLSIIFAIYGVTLSILAAIHDTKLIKNLLRKGSNSKKELENANKNVLFTIIFSVLIFISIQVLFSLLIENTIIFSIIIIISLNSLIVALFNMKTFFDKISKAFFNFSEHE